MVKTYGTYVRPRTRPPVDEGPAPAPAAPAAPKPVPLGTTPKPLQPAPSPQPLGGLGTSVPAGPTDLGGMGMTSQPTLVPPVGSPPPPRTPGMTPVSLATTLGGADGDRFGTAAEPPSIAQAEHGGLVTRLAESGMPVPQASGVIPDALPPRAIAPPTDITPSTAAPATLAPRVESVSPPPVQVPAAGGLRPGSAEVPGAIGDPVAAVPQLAPAGVSATALPGGVQTLGGRGGDQFGAALGSLGSTPRFTAPTFTADDNLRGTQINPTYNPQYADRAAEEVGRARVEGSGPLAGTDVSEVARLLGGAEGLVGDADLGTGHFAASGDADSARRYMMDSLGSLSASPDRAQLAAEAFDLMQARSQPQYERDARRLGAQQAALGRIGSGMADTAMRRFALERQGSLDLTKRELANAAAGQSLADNMSRLGAISGTAGQLGSEDLARAGFNANVDQARAGNALGRASALGSLAGQRFGVAQQGRADAESDRAYNTALQGTNADYALKRASAWTGLDSSRMDREAQQRDEMRGERDYQNTLAQQTYGNRLAQTTLDDQLTTSAAAREDSRLRMLLGLLGDQSAYPGALLAASGQQGGNAGTQGADAMQLLALWAQQQRQNQGAAGGAQPPFPSDWSY